MLHHMLRASAQRAFQTLDPYFKYVTMLLHGDGTNGAQNNTFVDSSTNNFTITRNGNTTQGTFTPYGSNWSNYFDGSSYFTSSTSQIVPTGSFTVECLVYVTSTGNQCFVAQGTSGNAGRFSLCIENSLWFAQIGSASINTGTPVANTWNYLAVTFNGSTLTLYVNGTSVGTASTTTSVQNNTLSIGTLGASWATTGYFVTGYISNVRVSSVVRTITTPTAPYTSDASTKLLACQSNRFIDSSSNAYVLNLSAGSPSVQRFSPFSPTTAYSTSVIGGSGYFDGSGDYLTAPNSTAFDFSTADFTIACWVYPTTSGTTRKIATYSNGTALNSNYAFTYEIDTNNKAKFLTINGSTVYSTVSTPSVITNAWNYLVVTRSGATINIYVNGTGTSGSQSATINNPSSSTLTIGAERDATVLLNGYMAGLVLLKGVATAPGSSNPTSPATSNGNTSLLLNFTNAGILDNAMMNDLETVGNAQISTSVKKYGTGSMYFDGSGDWLNASSSPNYGYGSGDFTLEFWAYPTSSSGIQVLIDQRTGSSTSAVPTIYTSSGTIYYYVSGSNRITGGSLSLNQWSHISICRSGTSTKLFINGTQSGSTFTDTTTYLNAPVRVGDGNDGAGPYPYSGYIDDLRITKGFARYTSNFTPPTAAFPNN